MIIDMNILEEPKEFKDLLYSTNYYHFKKVIFAISGGINYDIFKKSLNNFFI